MLIPRGVLENQYVFADGCARQALLSRHGSQGRLQGADRSKIKIGIAPLQQTKRFEAVTFQRLHKFRFERIAASGRAKGAVPGSPARSPRDLSKFSRIELSKLIAVELSVGCKRNVIDIEIESHTDRVGCHEIIDVSGLV